MSYQKVLEVANKFLQKLAAAPKSPVDQLYQEQRGKLSDFHNDFQRQLRSIAGELEGDLFTLRERGFDKKMWKMMASVYHTVQGVLLGIKEEKPYVAAEKLINYVLTEPHKSIIDNLDFLAKHHLKATSVPFTAAPTLKEAELHSLDKLKALAIHLKQFIEKNPLVRGPEPSAPPPALSEIVKQLGPEEKAGLEESTRAGVPAARKDKVGQ